jgi:hypothetical protein
MRGIFVGSLLCMALGLTACASSFARTARARGAKDVDCPADLVSAYRAEGGFFVARGCERWVEYICVDAAGPVCTPVSEPRPRPVPGS